MSAPAHACSPFAGDVLICAPHMDDETLGCGMLMALHALRGAVHVVFASDGARSPDPPPQRPDAALGLPAVREAEAVEALAVLGVPRSNALFLGLPDGTLMRHLPELGRLVADHARRVRAAYVLVPFRYDRHPDHLALNRAVTRARCDGRLDARIVEYFVYTRWRLLGTGDVRDYVAAEDAVRVRSESAAELKRAALGRYRSQTTRYFEGQRRPILTDSLLAEVCAEAETFLHHRPERNGRLGLARRRYWIPLACRIEPALKRWKDRALGARVQ